MGEIRVAVTGDVTLDSANTHHQWLAKIVPGALVVYDFAKVGVVDSTCISLMVSLKRNARINDSEAVFLNLPDSLRKLAYMYGVGQMLLDGDEPSSESVLVSDDEPAK